MAENTTPFVINDRRKFTAEGEPRHDVNHPSSEVTADEAKAETAAPKAAAETIPFPSSATVVDKPLPDTHTSSQSVAGTLEPEEAALEEDQLPPAPTAEQSEQALRAYAATVDRLDTAIRASNPGAERIPEMSFERFVQSLYMQAILQLGGGAEPGQQPQIDIIGARQTIDMLAIFAEKTQGNLEPAENNLLQSALFEARMGFLEVTQAMARQAAGRQSGAPGSPLGGPSIVR